MYDRTMPDASLTMEMHLTDEIAIQQPKPPYAIRAYREGDEWGWCAVETTAGEFPNQEQAMKFGFKPYFSVDSFLLPGRMFFVVDENDTPVATATAWFDGEVGCLHWVAVHADHQNKGLARPVISAAMAALHRLGYKKIILHTQPQSWVAIRLYIEFGFQPANVSDEKTRSGWQAVFEKIGKELPTELCAN